MAITRVQFNQTHTAVFHLDKVLNHARYDFGDLGKIHVQPAYFGCPDRLAVTISLGQPTDTSGYGLTGLQVDDYRLYGTVMCAGDDLVAGPHPSGGAYPLDDLDDDTKADAMMLLAEIAQHFHDTVN